MSRAGCSTPRFGARARRLHTRLLEIQFPPMIGFWADGYGLLILIALVPVSLWAILSIRSGVYWGLAWWIWCGLAFVLFPLDMFITTRRTGRF